MSNRKHFQNIEYKNIPINNNKREYFNKKSEKQITNQKDNSKNSKSLNLKKNKNIVINNDIYNNGIIKNNFNIFKKSDKNEFISISEIPEIENDNSYDNITYINLIENSIEEKNNPNNIKTVDANAYINNENNLISTFNDFKQTLLNKKNSLNSFFLFYKNNIDFASTKKVESEKNNQIKRYRYLTSYKYSFNPILRRKNSKIIQNWWRNKINPILDKKKKIIKIQSIFRGYISRKYLNDIICILVIYQNFINKLQHALGNYVHRNYFPKRYYKKKYALEKIFSLKLKLFFRRWRNIKKRYYKQDKAVEFLFKNRVKKRYILIVLKTYFTIWKLKCEHFMKNQNKYLALKNEHQKYIYKKKYAKKIMKLYNKYNIKRNMNKIIEKWRMIIWKEKENNLKLKVLINEIKYQIRKNDKDFMRNNINCLRSNANIQTINNSKRAKKVFLFPKVIDHIVACTRKNTIRLIFKEYIRKRDIEKKILKILRKRNMRYYFNKWNKLIKSLLYKDKFLFKLKNMINKLSYISRNTNLQKYINRWKKKVNMNKLNDTKINNYNDFCNSLKKYINNNKMLKLIKKIFLKEKLNKYFHLNRIIIKKRLLKCFNNFVNYNKNGTLKKFLNKWKRYVQFSKLNELKAKNLETVSKLTKIIYNSKKLSKNLHEWKNKKDIININNKYKNEVFLNGLIDCLTKIKNNRLKQFYFIIRIAKKKLMKKIIIKNLYNKYLKKNLFYYLFFKNNK